MTTKGLIYSFVAKGTVVLAEHTPYSGNFSTIAVQWLQTLPSNSSKSTYTCDGRTFSFLLDSGFDESMGRSIPFVFLEKVKDDFKQRYGDSIRSDGPNPLADDDQFEDRFSIAYNLDREFGPELKEHMQYFVNHPEEMNKLSTHKLSTQAQTTEANEIKMDNIEKVSDDGEKTEVVIDETENLQVQAESFQLQERQLRRQICLQNLMFAQHALFGICFIWFMYCVYLRLKEDKVI